MRTKLTITVTAVTSDPLVEKKIYLATEDNDLLSIIDLLEYCESAEATYEVVELLNRKLITKHEN